jgi:hypothetical protein
MDGFTEKKWFVYLNDHHEGPFSVEEIQAKIDQGQLSTTNYVWAEGMADWKLMTEVQAFDSLTLPQVAPAAPSHVAAQQLGTGPDLTTVTAAPSAGFSAISLESQTSSAPILESAGPTLMSERMVDMHGNEHMPPELDDDLAKIEALSKLDPKKALAGNMVKLGLVLLFVAGIGIAYNDGYLSSLLNSQKAKTLTVPLSNAVDTVLTKLGVSPIPKLDDVDSGEYEQLKAAAKANLEETGPQISLAISKADLITPTFYVGSNLPDGAILDVYVEGIPDSLLNQLSFNVKTQVTITKKFGKTLPIQFPPNQKAFPRGQYNLYIVDPETQPAIVASAISKMVPVVASPAPVSVPKGLRVLSTKSYFLGGLKDATYTARLQDFHAKLTARAAQELTELKQIAGTLDSELTDTTTKFAAATSLKKAKKISPAQKKMWATFDTQWSGINQQLGQTFSQLTPEALQSGYFYGSVYQFSQQVAEKLNALHTLQNGFFTTPPTDTKAFDIQLGEATSIARSSIDELKVKISQIESSPPTPNGLPRRDGI